MLLNDKIFFSYERDACKLMFKDVKICAIKKLYSEKYTRKSYFNIIIIIVFVKYNICAMINADKNVNSQNINQLAGVIALINKLAWDCRQNLHCGWR